MARHAITASVRSEVLIEAGYRCAVPTCRTILAIDLHHLEPVADGGGNKAANLLALCPNCHQLHHRGTIPAEALRVWKGMLVSLNEGIGKEAKDLLLLLGMDRLDRPLSYSGDGVLRFAPLIVAGLVKITGTNYVRDGYYSYYYDPETELSSAEPDASLLPTKYRAELTDRGQAFVLAWKQGNPTALEHAQRMP